MSRHVYQDRGAVYLYDRSHGLIGTSDKSEPVDGPGHWCPEAAALRVELNEGLERMLPNDRPAYVLDVGVGNGHWFFNPLIDQLAASPGRQRLGFALGIDNSQPMLEIVETYWSERKPAMWRRFELSDLIEWWSGAANAPFDGPTVGTALVDIEDIVLNLSSTGHSMARFDIIGVMGVLHHTLSWRLVLDLLVRRFLAPGGVVVISERCADAVDADGSGSYKAQLAQSEPLPGVRGADDLRLWRALWEDYYFNRSALGVPWEPEIRVSDMSAAVDALRMRGFTSVEGWPKERVWSVDYSCDEIRNWLRNPPFSNFRRHLAGRSDDKMAGETEALRRIVDSHLNGRSAFSVRDGWRIHLLTGPR